MGDADGPGGRKKGTKIGFTPARRAAYLSAYRDGWPVHTCCAAASIDWATVQEWTRLGEGVELDRPVSATRREQAIIFVADLKGVDAEREAGVRRLCRQTIERAAIEGFLKVKVKRITRPDGSQEITEESERGAPVWQSAAWYLERDDPRRYGTGQDRLAALQAEGVGGLLDAEDLLPRLRMLLAGDDDLRRQVRELCDEIAAEP